MSGRCSRPSDEQTRQAARLRHRQPARLGARAAGDVGERARSGARETRRRQTPIEAPRDPLRAPTAARTFWSAVTRTAPSPNASASSPIRRSCVGGQIAEHGRNRARSNSLPASAGSRSSVATWRNRPALRATRGSSRGWMPGPMSRSPPARLAISSVDGRGGLASAARSSTGGCSGSNGSARPLERPRLPRARVRIPLGSRSQPERLDEELQPIPLLVLVVAEPMEDADDGFGARRACRRPEETRTAPGRRATASRCRRRR